MHMNVDLHAKENLAETDSTNPSFLFSSKKRYITLLTTCSKVH